MGDVVVVVAEAAREVELASTPCSVWDEFGHLYLMLEDLAPTTVGRLALELQGLNQRDNGLYPDTLSDVARGLQQLAAKGLVELRS